MYTKLKLSGHLVENLPYLSNDPHIRVQITEAKLTITGTLTLLIFAKEKTILT